MASPWKIPLARPAIAGGEEQAALRVLRSGWLTQGPEVAAFEEELAAAAGRRFAVAVSSGTAALHLSLWGLGVGPGQAVRVPAFTFPATAAVVRLVGAEVELHDVNPATWCMRLPPKLEGAPRSLTVQAAREVLEEARLTLGQVTLRDGKPEPAVLAALSDPLDLKRAAAAEALCRAGVKEQRAKV